MDIYLNISGLNIRIVNSPFSVFKESLEPFIKPLSKNNVDINYYVNIYNSEIYIDGMCIMSNDRISVYSNNAGKYTVKFVFDGFNGKNVCYTIFDYTKGNAEIFVPSDFASNSENSGFFIALLAIDFILLNFGRIMMHGSIVEYNSEGIIFTGPSGIGKSTQSELWKKYRGASVVNGDRAIIDTKGDRILAYGSPWAGSSDIYFNKFVPVKAIVLLGQDKTNHIEKVIGSDLYKNLIPRMSIAGWDNYLMGICMDIIGTIIENVPVYKLYCYPGEEAVNLLQSVLFEE